MDAQYKYVYWYYKDEDKKIYPAEELFDIVDDPYEMKNLANNPQYEKQLNKMRKLYDEQLDHWKREGVKYNGYEDYETMFTRTLNITHY